MADTLARRAGHAALAGIAGTLAWAAAEELSSRKPVRVGALVVLASAATAGLGIARTSSKAYATEQRFNNLLDNGGTFGGDVHVKGDHNVQGAINMTGASGVNTNGNNVNMSGGNVSSIGFIGGGGNRIVVNDGLNMSNNRITQPGSVGPWNGNSAGLVGDSGATTVAGLRDYVNGQFGRLRNTGIG